MATNESRRARSRAERGAVGRGVFVLLSDLVTAGTRIRVRHPHGASGPANLGRANLKGADLYGANLKFAELLGAVADEDTRWPAWFDPVKRGVIFH